MHLRNGVIPTNAARYPCIWVCVTLTPDRATIPISRADIEGDPRTLGYRRIIFLSRAGLCLHVLASIVVVLGCDIEPRVRVQPHLLVCDPDRNSLTFPCTDICDAVWATGNGTLSLEQLRFTTEDKVSRLPGEVIMCYVL